MGRTTGAHDACSVSVRKVATVLFRRTDGRRVKPAQKHIAATASRPGGKAAKACRSTPRRSASTRPPFMRGSESKTAPMGATRKRQPMSNRSKPKTANSAPSASACAPNATYQKNLGHPLGTTAERQERITVMKNDYKIADLCAALDVSPSGYYAHCYRQHQPGPRARKDAELTTQITAAFARSHGTYGAPRIQAELRQPQQPLPSRKRIARLMREARLSGRTRRPATKSKPPTATTAARSRPTTSKANPRPPARIKSGAPTSRISKPAKAGSTSARSKLSTAANKSAGP